MMIQLIPGGCSFFNPFPNKLWFIQVWIYKSFENTVEKGEIAHNEEFLLFPQCFLPIWRTFCHFPQVWNFHLQTLSVWKSLKFVVWERIKFLHFLEQTSVHIGIITTTSNSQSQNKRIIFKYLCTCGKLQEILSVRWSCQVKRMGVW